MFLKSSNTLKILNKRTLLFTLVGMGLLILGKSGYSGELYFLCGSDEDGCYNGNYKFCSCIPYNETEANTPYCLDFDNLTCTPLSQSPQCDPTFIHKNQGECLATIFQSHPTPPCTIKTQAFCIEHQTMKCDANGQPESCH